MYKYRATVEFTTKADIPDNISFSEGEAKKFFEENLLDVNDVEPDFVKIERIG